jgi:hypothetical protein
MNFDWFHFPNILPIFELDVNYRLSTSDVHIYNKIYLDGDLHLTLIFDDVYF